MIISVEKARQHLESEEDVQFIDCRFDLSDPTAGLNAYKENHLPRAIYLDLEKDLSGEVKKTGGRHPLPDLEAFIQTLASLGISKHTTVIAYDQNHAFASRLAWMLKLVGHESVYVLNGGYDAWMKADFPTESGDSEQAPTVEYGSYSIDFNLVCDQKEVKDKIDQKGVKLIDSRSYERYAGHHEPIDAKAGHIPSAWNYDWMRLMDDDGYFKSKDDLQKHFAKLKKSQEIIVYCGSGVTAVPNVIGLWLAGYSNVKLYVGSFSDWITNQDNEVHVINSEEK